MKIIYENKNIVVVVKPYGMLSEGDQDGMPSLIKASIESPKHEIYVVHRLDRHVGGIMVFAKNKQSAAEISTLVFNQKLSKSYYAVIQGELNPKSGTMEDLLFHDSAKNQTYIVSRKRKGVREGILKYSVVASKNDLSLVRVTLVTGRTHQIRAQFSSRKVPIVGDRKYGSKVITNCIALWSFELEFNNQKYCALPPTIWPWTEFVGYSTEYEKEDFQYKNEK